MLIEPRAFGGGTASTQITVPAAAFTSPQVRNRKTHLNAPTTDTATLGGLVWSCRQEKQRELLIQGGKVNLEAFTSVVAR